MEPYSYGEASARTDASEPEKIENREKTEKKQSRSSPYVVRVELAVPGQGVQQALDVGFEDAVDHRVVRLVQVLPESVPEVKRNFHHLFQKRNSTFCHRCLLVFSLRSRSRQRNRLRGGPADSPLDDGTCTGAPRLGPSPLLLLAS